MSTSPFAPFTPAAFGRSSSPLNPHSHPPSSSPMTSPTPLPSSSRIRPYGFDTGDEAHAGPSNWNAQSAPLQVDPMFLNTPPVRLRRPAAASQQSLPASLGLRPTAPRANSSPSRPGSSGDIFTEPAGSTSTSGASPLEGQMWRDRLDRRITERDRRQQARRNNMTERRGMGVGSRAEGISRTGRSKTEGRRGNGEEADDDEWDEEAERRQAADDEEIYRRLMLLQRRKAAHAALVSHERETGGSDPLLPEFWEDEDNAHFIDPHSSPALGRPVAPLPSVGQATCEPFNPFQTPPRHVRAASNMRPAHHSRGRYTTQADAEAAEAAEAELAEQIEREMAMAFEVDGEDEDMEMNSARDAGPYSDMDFGDIDWDAVDELEQVANWYSGRGRGPNQAAQVDPHDVDMD